MDVAETIRATLAALAGIGIVIDLRQESNWSQYAT